MSMNKNPGPNTTHNTPVSNLTQQLMSSPYNKIASQSFSMRNPDPRRSFGPEQMNSLRSRDTRTGSDIDTFSLKIKGIIPTNETPTSHMQEEFSVKDFTPASGVKGRPIKTQNQEVRFIHRKGWKDNEACFVCRRVFETIKGFMAHHCRVCGHAVCGDCSSGRIREERVCDICLNRHRNKKKEQERNRILRKMNEEILTGKYYLRDLHQEFGFSRQLTKGEREEVTKENGVQDAKERSEIQKERALQNLKRAKDKNEELKNDIKEEETQVKTKEARLEEIKMQISALQLQLNQKMTIYKCKTEELEKAKHKKNILNEAKGSFLDPKDPKASLLSARNFSIMTVDKNGKYNISSQAYKI